MTFYDPNFIIRTDPIDSEIISLYAYLGTEVEVHVPDGVTNISSYAFADKEKPNDTITKIILPDSVNHLEPAAFAYCRSLKEIRWPENPDFTTLQVNLFDGCQSLEKIVLPKTVEMIVPFALPENLKEIEIHDDLIAIFQSSFTYENPDYDEIYFNRETITRLLKNPNYKLIDGFMVNTKHKTAVFYAERNKKEVRIPDGIEMISTFCFDEYGFFEAKINKNAYFNTKLVPIEKVILPKSVKMILGSAFFHCKSLKSVIYEGKTSNLQLDEEVFDDCGYFSYHDSKIICSDTKNETLSKTELRLKRIKIIHRLIKEGAFPNAEELLEACNEALRNYLPIGKKYKILTIYRDIQFMKDVFNAPIDHDFTEKGYYYYGKDFTLTLE